jgi:hypothetical protein
MKNALRAYGALLRLYPASYRQEFGAEMLQTFRDHYFDIQNSKAETGAVFWFSAIVDETKNIVRQNVSSLGDANGFFKPSWPKVLTALFVLPFYVLCSAATVKLSLAIPHPAVSGLGAVLALAMTLVIVPAAISVVSSYFLAFSIVRMFRRKRTASA